jgi:siroheme decarboxylase
MLTVDRQNAIARAIQGSFPLEQDPWTAIAHRTGVHRTAVYRQVLRWRDEGMLREISAVLEGSALGYESALCAGHVPEADLPRVAALINEHPTITHNYRRSHRYNLWFTLAVPHDMGIEPTLARLAVETGVPRFHALHRTRTFKIGVNFDLTKRCSVTEKRALSRVSSVALGDEERQLFRALQTPLPIAEAPFAHLCQKLGMDEQELLAFGRKHMGGAMRRYVATFHHRALGVRGNGMAVWAVPEADHARVGAILAAAPEVSHCYARNAIEGFPYTVYSMIHGPDEASVQSVVSRLSRETGAEDVLILFSTHEYKKCRLRYFLPALDSWWARHARGLAA